MKKFIVYIFLFCFCITGKAQSDYLSYRTEETARKLKEYIDTLKIIDTHEHLLNPDFLRKTNILDFFLLMNHYYYDDLITAGMPEEFFNKLYNGNMPPEEKWKLIEPYWNRSLNTSFALVAKVAARNLFNVNEINANTVGILTQRIKSAYNNKNWFETILKDSCRIEYLVQDDDALALKVDWIKYVKRFTPWLNVRTKFGIDSIAMEQVEPIFTLEDFVKSLRNEFEKGLKNGMVGIKVISAYSRNLYFEKTDIAAARKVFKTLVSGDEDLQIPWEKAKPLQDYMFHQLMEMAKQHGVPVIFHTGLQAGQGNDIRNSNPVLLANLFHEYPDVRFVLFHGSYPYGGELATLAKTYSNVYIDMNWTYAISPSYAKRYLSEWLETIPASKIMAFGGDYNCVENIYGVYQIAKQIITEVLTEKVSNNQLSENEARQVAKMILHDNAVEFYGLP
ncbi:MAG TPA: amidohydrolase family protein [Bacteroidales bacterium]|nr:amidohydrolase family protein [Bacteroidales bacterium]HPP92239.1 amidohydrolase family protein [Bacteroidales bacterium]HRR17144.1 amidohydrolase family protein [Bacteroidales bacterium]HRU56008.1 amidohydrolase family protein [Bacteroidales bacterium]